MRTVRRDMPNDRRRAGGLPASCYCHEAVPPGRGSCRERAPRRITILDIILRCAPFGAICQTTDSAQGASGEPPLPRSRPPGRARAEGFPRESLSLTSSPDARRPARYAKRPTARRGSFRRTAIATKPSPGGRARAEGFPGESLSLTFSRDTHCSARYAKRPTARRGSFRRTAIATKPSPGGAVRAVRDSRRITIVDIFPRSAPSGAICQTTDSAQGASSVLPPPRNRPRGAVRAERGFPGESLSSTSSPDPHQPTRYARAPVPRTRNTRLPRR